ncbi:hypothetical protein LJC36_03390 [Desulfovibrio sp. OttesenSCG-928-C14]|nr:hypothetical protein [Desulfovibrio sp. OttesenSCG-928-C14]
MRNVAWWLAYIIAAIWLQKFLPGVDALVPGLLICFQENSKRQTIIFLLFCMLIQEGTGTLPFGPSILWYGYVFACFHAGGLFFLPSGNSFILGISTALCVGRACLFMIMGELQSTPLDAQDILFQCFGQAVITPLGWILAGKTRNKVLKNAH